MPKTIPIRQCIGCREQKPKPELIRVVRSPSGEVSLDPRGKASGRGAYLCRSADCMKRAIKQKQLERAFECPMGEETHASLLEALKELEAQA